MEIGEIEMEKEKENPDWFSDLEKEKVDKASEIPPQIDLPTIADTPIEVEITSKPFNVEVKSRNETMLVCNAKRTLPQPTIEKGTMILPKSLRFNIAKALKQSGKDYLKTDLKGLKIRIWSILQDGNKYYQAEIL